MMATRSVSKPVSRPNTARDTAVVRAYHRLLVWDIMSRPRATRLAERLLNPLVGKSLVLYFRKPGDSDAS